MKRSILRFAPSVLIVTAVATVIWVNAGNLNPPGGPVLPTMKALDQVEARTIVNATNTPGDGANTFIISAPGSYYLTGNINGVSGRHGISIQANDVTLDLNGFALISGGGTVRGVNVPAAQTNFTIRNGSVRGWSDGGVRTDLATNMFAEKLRLSDNVGATGLFLGNGSVKDCEATGNATAFILGLGAQIKDCAATFNSIGFSSADRCMISNCIATNNTSEGFNCTSFVTLIDCTSSRNTGTGIVVGATASVIRCNSSRNIPSGYGINAGAGCTIADCTTGSNGLDGIQVDSGSTVRNCTARANVSRGISANNGGCHLIGNTCEANQLGIFVQGSGSPSGDRNRVEGNSCTLNTTGYVINGIHNLIIRNSASGNSTNFSSFPAPNAAVPIVDMSAGGTIASTNPWANFIH